MPLADFAAAYDKIKQAGSPSLRAKQSISPRGSMDCFVASLVLVAAGRPVQTCLFVQNHPRSVLAKALTERVERRTSDGGDLYNPAPADCPDIQPTY